MPYYEDDPCIARLPGIKETLTRGASPLSSLGATRRIERYSMLTARARVGKSDRPTIDTDAYLRSPRFLALLSRVVMRPAERLQVVGVPE